MSVGPRCPAVALSWLVCNDVVLPLVYGISCFLVLGMGTSNDCCSSCRLSLTVLCMSAQRTYQCCAAVCRSSALTPPSSPSAWVTISMRPMNGCWRASSTKAEMLGLSCYMCWGSSSMASWQSIGLAEPETSCEEKIAVILVLISVGLLCNGNMTLICSTLCFGACCSGLRVAVSLA